MSEPKATNSIESLFFSSMQGALVEDRSGLALRGLTTLAK